MLIIPEFDLTISIVLFHTNVEELENVIDLLNRSALKIKIFLIDNSPSDELRSTALKFQIDYVFNNANLGYGRGHNIAIRLAEPLADYHLVMNSDVSFDPAILEKALVCMRQHPDIGLISPKIRLRNGEMEHFCRLLPTPFDLFARRFIPSLLKPLFKARLDRYILNVKDYSKSMNVPNLPGCFMFLRQSSLKLVNGFDEEMFLYVEDVDLTRRLYQITKTIYYPQIEIVHGFARGSYKFSKLVLFHINSAIYYFNKWGWFNDSGRALINQEVILDNNYVNIDEPTVLGIPQFKSAM